MKWGLLACYGFLVLIGSVLILLNLPEREQFIALKALDRNHRLVAGDIAEAGFWHRFLTPSLTNRDDFNGRYVAARVEALRPILIEQTLAVPAMTTDPGRSIVWLSLGDLPPADVQSLDVHRTLDVCNINGNEVLPMKTSR